MIDPKLLRSDAAGVAYMPVAASRSMPTHYLALEDKRKSLQVEQIPAGERNKSAKSIGQAKAKGEDIEPLLAAVNDLASDWSRRSPRCRTAG